MGHALQGKDLGGLIIWRADTEKVGRDNTSAGTTGQALLLYYTDHRIPSTTTLRERYYYPLSWRRLSNQYKVIMTNKWQRHDVNPKPASPTIHAFSFFIIFY